MSFYQDVTEYLEGLLDRLEAFSYVDADLTSPTALTLRLGDGQVYLLTAHENRKEIWLSSPVSGAHHFKYENETWKNTRVEGELETFLMQELEVYQKEKEN